MKRDIILGDSVAIYWTDHPTTTGIVEALPTEGDELWYVRDNFGYVHGINSRSSGFERIVTQSAKERHETSILS